MRLYILFISWRSPPPLIPSVCCLHIPAFVMTTQWPSSLSPALDLTPLPSHQPKSGCIPSLTLLHASLPPCEEEANIQQDIVLQNQLIRSVCCSTLDCSYLRALL